MCAEPGASGLGAAAPAGGPGGRGRGAGAGAVGPRLAAGHPEQAGGGGAPVRQPAAETRPQEGGS